MKPPWRHCLNYLINIDRRTCKLILSQYSVHPLSVDLYPLSYITTLPTFHSRLKTHLFHKSFPP